MTKLNYQRPELRYYDNIRREMRTQCVGATPGDYPLSNYAEPRDALDGSQSSKPRMPVLTAKEERLALNLLDALQVHGEADAAFIQTLRPKKMRKGNSKNVRARMEKAESQLLEACREYCLELMISGINGRTNLGDFLRYLRATFAEHDDCGAGSSWEVLNWAIGKASEPLLEAANRLINQDGDGDSAPG